jgi:transcription elongation factor GreA
LHLQQRENNNKIKEYYMAYMSQEGYDKLVAELQRLESVERPKASAAIAEARDKGDLSENSEYDAAKEAQAHLEAKIAQMKLTIADAKIVDTSRLSTDAVQIMSKVEMTNMTTNQKMVYTIVSETEANLKEGKISIKTPIAQGLLNKKVGDIAEIKIPRGTIKMRIDSISLDA